MAFFPGGSSLRELYESEKCIGQGTFSIVYLCKRKSDDLKVAVKKIDKKNTTKAEVAKEISVLKRLKHPSIVTLLNDYEDEDFYYLVLPYIEGKDLFSHMDERHMTPLPEATARKIFKQIVEVVTYCHSQGVAHLDLKLENILLSPTGKIYLIDFGLCEVQLTTRRPSNSFVGSIDYASPEILDRKPFDSFKADIWSLGTMLYCLVYAAFPFSADARYHGSHPPLDFIFDVSKSLEDLLMKMLKDEPSERCSITDVGAHKWLKPSILSKFFT